MWASSAFALFRSIQWGHRKITDQKYWNPAWQQIQQPAPTLRGSCGSKTQWNPEGDTVAYVDPGIPARISISLAWLRFVDVKIWSEIPESMLVANPRGFILSNLVFAWNKRRREKEETLSFPTVPVPASNSFRQPRTRVLKIAVFFQNVFFPKNWSEIWSEACTDVSWIFSPLNLVLVESNEKTRKRRLTAFQRYQSQLLTPSDNGERWFWKSTLLLDFNIFPTNAQHCAFWVVWDSKLANVAHHKYLSPKHSRMNSCWAFVGKILKIPQNSRFFKTTVLRWGN